MADSSDPAQASSSPPSNDHHDHHKQQSSLSSASHLQHLSNHAHTRGQESFSRSRSSTGAILDAVGSPDDLQNGDAPPPSDPTDMDFDTAFAHHAAHVPETSDAVQLEKLSEEQHESKHDAVAELESWAHDNDSSADAPFTPHLTHHQPPALAASTTDAPPDPPVLADSFASAEQQEDDEWSKALGHDSTADPDFLADPVAGDASLAQMSAEITTDETLQELEEPLLEHDSQSAQPEAPADAELLDAAKEISADLGDPETEADTSWIQSDQPQPENDLEDSWAKAMGGSGDNAETSWEAALGGAIDEDGFLDDEDGFLEDEPVEAASAAAAATTSNNAYMPRSSSIPQPALTPFGMPKPAVQQPSRPQGGDRTASGGMKFFEELPMTAPVKARKKPIAMGNVPSGPPPPPPSAVPPPSAGPPSARATVSSQAAVQPPPRGSSTLEMFPAQPTVAPHQPPSRSPSFQAPAPASRYSPAPAQAPTAAASRYASAGAAPAAPSQYAPSQPSMPQQTHTAPSTYTPASADPPHSSAQPSLRPPPAPAKPNSRYSPAPKAPAPGAAPMTAQQSPPNAYGAVEDAPPGTTPIPPSLASHRFAPRTSSPLASPDWRPGLDRSTTAPIDAMAQARSSLDKPVPPPPQGPSPLESMPRRPRTQSPETAKAKPAMRHVSNNELKSPASASAPGTTPGLPKQLAFQTSAPHTSDAHLNFTPPPDPLLAADPLQRWRGAPVFHWSTGGLVAAHFPRHVPMFGGGQSAPSIKSSAGGIRLEKIKTSVPVDETFVSFPGPLKSKGKKKELLTWLTSRIEAQQREASTVNSDMMNPRASERQMLWQLLRIFIEHDGILSGNPAVDLAVRGVLTSPGRERSDSMQVSASTRPDTSNPDAMMEIKQLLLNGDRDKAVWLAADNRLWGHAMIISSTAPDGALWKQVAQEFVRTEVRSASVGSKSLAATYEIFAQNWDESVDELVPASARAGFEMMSSDRAGKAGNALEGLNKWQETVKMVLSTRSVDDERGLLALGKLLRGYGRVEAAHICFLFARSCARPGGLDDEEADFTLLGADASQDALQDVDAILLSEVFEFGLSLSPNSGSHFIPHLQAYKLHHAHVLADNGGRDTALAYCDNIATAVKSMTRMSPYFHPAFASELDNLTKRLSEAPKDSSSWISKPTLGKVSSSMWTRFNTFVTGEDDAASNASGQQAEAENSPFGRVAGTPTISRHPSAADLASFTPMNGIGVGMGAGAGLTSPPIAPSNSRYAPGYQPQPAPAAGPVHASNPYQPTTPASSNPYAPSGQYAPATPQEIPKPGSSGNPYNPYHPSANLGISDTASQVSSSYDPPILQPPPSQRFGGFEVGSPAMTHASSRVSSSHGPPSNPSEGQEMSVIDEEEPVKANGHVPPMYGNSYEPPPATGALTELDEPESMGGYAPPTGGYAPPSAGYQPYEPASPGQADLDDTVPKKKSIMDDDDDDGLMQRAAAMTGSDRAARDRAADDAFRKAAEEDAQRDKESKEKRQSGGWFGGWFKKDPNAPTVHRAKLGEESSFYYDPETKKWVNKKGGAEAPQAAAPAPPPPRAGPPMGSKPPSGSASPSLGAPPMAGPPPTSAPGGAMPPMAGPPGGSPGLPPTSRAGTPAGEAGPPVNPPSRPATSMSNASSIDDLIGAPSARKAGAGGKKGKKGGRYVDVMAK